MKNFSVFLPQLETLSWLRLAIDNVYRRHSYKPEFSLNPSLGPFRKGVKGRRGLGVTGL